jgi:hypothetical protein
VRDRPDRHRRRARRDVHEGAGLRFAKRRQERIRQPDRGEQIEREAGLPLLVRDGREPLWESVAAARVVHEDVKAAEGVERSGGDGLHLRDGGDVARDERGARG